MIRIFKYFKKKEWVFAAICLVLVVVQVWLDLKLPDYMSEITTLVQTDGSSMAEILAAGGAMLACALGSLVAAMAVGYFAAQIAAGLAMRLREMVYNKTLSFSMEEMNGFSTASLITRSTNDITQIQTLVAMGLQAVVKAPILAVWAIAKIAGKNVSFTLTTGVAIVLLLVMLCVILFFAVPKSKMIQSLTDNLNLVTREHLTGIRVVRAYNAEAYQETKFEKANEELTAANLFVNQITAIISPSMTFISSGLTLAIYWIGSYLINQSAQQGKLTLFSDMVVFSAYAMQVIMAFMMLTMIFIMLPRSVVSAKRILEVLDTKEKITDGTVTQTDGEQSGEIVFDNVSFHYPGAAESVLNQISFTIHTGETAAFIGSTGSGKSTLINLIPRFYDCTEGEVRIDGINVKDYTQAALRNKIGYISQKAVLFSGTIRSNIAYGDNGRNDQTQEDITRAVSLAQAEDFVEQYGLESAVSQGGTNLSGGQKQRLSIARAIYRQPEILVFDDSFSALDYKTDKVLRSELAEHTQDVTKLIVAQRIGTIKDVDKIIVLDEGKIAGMGTHSELLQTCTVYKEIALSQLTKEELAYES
ncbi:MAG: ABC transporter ATP-binding protein [Lachnospiraceae bacterium]